MVVATATVEVVVVVAVAAAMVVAMPVVACIEVYDWEGEAVDSVRGRRSEPMQSKDTSTTMIVRPKLPLSLSLLYSSKNRIGKLLGGFVASRSTKRKGSGGNGCCRCHSDDQSRRRMVSFERETDGPGSSIYSSFRQRVL